MIWAVAALAAPAPAADSGTHLGKQLAEWRVELDSSNRVERLVAARAIGEMAIAGGKGADKALTALAHHEDPAVRYWTVVALGRMGGRARFAKGALQRALADEAADVRVWAARALVGLGEDEQAVPVLVEELQGPEAAARLHAAHALDDIAEHAKPAIPALERAVEDEFDYVQRVARDHGSSATY